MPWQVEYIHASSHLRQQTKIQMYLNTMTLGRFTLAQSALRDTCPLGAPVQSRTAAYLYYVYYV